jgi:hypothetical protein
VLNVRRIMVMGHARCGGVAAMLSGAPADCQDFVAPWVQQGAHGSPSARLRAPWPSAGFISASPTGSCGPWRVPVGSRSWNRVTRPHGSLQGAKHGRSLLRYRSAP